MSRKVLVNLDAKGAVNIDHTVQHIRLRDTDRADFANHGFITDVNNEIGRHYWYENPSFYDKARYYGPAHATRAHDIAFLDSTGAEIFYWDDSVGSWISHKPIWLVNDPTETNQAATKQYVDAQVDAVGVPVGAVFQWAGSSVNVPAGWLLCDGAPFLDTAYPELAAILGAAFGVTTMPNGYPVGTKLLPDMRDRFVVGAGSAYAVNEKGGASTVALTEANLASHDHSVDPPAVTSGLADVSHTHTMTDHTHAMPHTHNFGGEFINDVSATGSAARYRSTGGPTATGASSAASTGNPTNPQTGGHSVNHDHSVNIAAFNSATAGSGTAHENKPPYIGLLFIIKAIP